MAAKIMDALKKAFNPEFLNRIDDVVIFHALSKDDITRIIDIELDKVKARLDERSIRLRVTPGAKNLLIDKGFDRTYGARHLKRTIQKLLEDPLAEEILQGRFADGSRVRAIKKGEALVFDDERESSEAVEEKRGEVAS
jgi:ATP-dependent Clp protease ATP-binding subunit ClpC